MKTPPLDAVSSADTLRKRHSRALILVGLGAFLGLLSVSHLASGASSALDLRLEETSSSSSSSSISTSRTAPSYLRATTLPRFLQDDAAQCEEACCRDTYTDLACEEAASTNPLGSAPLYVQIIMIVLLIIMSAFFSGLTLGLMGLDKTGLEIVMEGDDERFKEYATKIYPLRKRGNLLLCTLLLGNVAVNSLLSILTADKFGGTVGLLSSTFLIVIFGEITPQAFCQRYSLEVGSAMVPVVRVILVLLYPIAFPLSYALDKALGEELATTYSSSEMLKLLQIHVAEEVMHPDTATAMQGALKFKDLTVKEVMTPVAMTFMLSAEERLTFETIAKIFKTGYSRIPIFHVSKVRFVLACVYIRHWWCGNCV
jgi:metal transporter CNNM